MKISNVPPRFSWKLTSRLAISRCPVDEIGRN
jgi:hypothetical protein